MSFLQRLTVFCLLFSAIASLQWAPSPRDGEILYVCEGEDVTIPWSFNLTAGEEITSIEWLFRGISEEMVAFFSHSAFVPLPAFSDRVEQVANGGLVLHHVTMDDVGNYTIEINGRDSTGDLYESLAVFLQVSDSLQTTDGQIHVTQQRDVILDTASREWSIVLCCGHFTYAGPPAFPVEWVAPTGAILTSTTYNNGYFNLHLSNPVEAGSYVCRVPEPYVTTACLHGDRSQTGQASVKVDWVEAGMTIIRAELGALRTQNQQLQQDLIMRDNHLTQRLDDLEITQRADNASLTQLIEDSRTPRISFNAQSTQYQYLSTPTHLKFDTVLYNQGGAFNSTTGDFTAPVSGTYVFYFHTLSDPSHDAHSSIKINSREVCRAFILPDYQHGSCQAVVHMLVGHRAWVQPYSDNKYYSEFTTSFMGFLLSGDPQ